MTGRVIGGPTNTSAGCNEIIVAVKPQTKKFSPLEVVVLIVVAQTQAGSGLSLKSLDLNYHAM